MDVDKLKWVKKEKLKLKSGTRETESGKGAV
jgi:hypothetical protein